MAPEAFEWLLTKAPAKVDAGSTPQGLLDDDLRGYLSSEDAILGRLLDDAHGKGTAGALRPRGKPTPISKPCGEQFTGRTVVASCSVQARVRWDAGPEWRLGLEILYFDALASDAAMKNCLSAKGDWQELPKDSAKFLREKHDQLLRRVVQDLPE